MPEAKCDGHHGDPELQYLPLDQLVATRAVGTAPTTPIAKGKKEMDADDAIIVH